MKLITQEDCDIKNTKLMNKIICFDYPSQPSFINMSGITLDYLHIDKYIGRTYNKNSVFKCTCVCGNVVLRTGDSLRRNHIHSCGCKHDRITKFNKTKITHGDSKRGNASHLYMIWCSMRYRCYKPNNQKYSEYGGRGITVDESWLGKNGYSSFREWALNNGYIDGLTLDRINPDGNYCPDNCRWVSYDVQNLNKRSTPYLVIEKYALPISIWARIYKIHYDIITSRIEDGWSPFEAVTTPSTKSKDECAGYLYVPPEFDIYNKYSEFLDTKKIVEYTDDHINIQYIFAHDNNRFY